MGLFKDAVKAINENCKLLTDLSEEKLREMAKKDEITTQFGSASYVSEVRSRSAEFTEVVFEADESHKSILNDVLAYLKGKELLCTDAQMCKTYPIHCRCYHTTDFARIPFMWKKSMYPATNPKSRPDIIVVHIPEWKERMVLVDPNDKVTFVLGTDYFGECKKANLRMAMYIMKQSGGLGLHAGSKTLCVKEKNTQLIEKNFLLFGLSGTGKTTLTVHSHDLADGESIKIRQDDVVLMDKDAHCYGTEKGFYIKTEGLGPHQRILYDAAMQPHAVLDNVCVTPDGKVSFKNTTLTTNGRCMIQRSDVEKDDNIDLEKAQVIIFIVRRDEIVPPVAKLNHEQAAAFFMLGESIETSAGDPKKAGQPKRCVGTNPFIIGPEYEEGNRFYEILKANPDIECYILNTGHVGGVENGEKITIDDSTKIIEMIARGNIAWKETPFWHYRIPVRIDGIKTQKLDPANYYMTAKYMELCEALMRERNEWLDQFPGLKDEIKHAL